MKHLNNRITNDVVDVIIVGGGLMGLLSAYCLHESGASVIVLEKNKVGKEASWAGGGILSPLYPWQYPNAVNDLATYSQHDYASFCEGLYQRTDYDPEWLQSGLLLTDTDILTDADAITCQKIQAWRKQYPQRMTTLGCQQLKQLNLH